MTTISWTIRASEKYEKHVKNIRIIAMVQKGDCTNASLMIL